MKKIVNGIEVNLTAEEIVERENEIKINESKAVEFYAKQYQRDREEEYPSIQDQLDMQYWDSINGTTTWKDAVAKVKADNPKV